MNSATIRSLYAGCLALLGLMSAAAAGAQTVPKPVRPPLTVTLDHPLHYYAPASIAHVTVTLPKVATPSGSTVRWQWRSFQGRRREGRKPLATTRPGATVRFDLPLPKLGFYRLYVSLLGPGGKTLATAREIRIGVWHAATAEQRAASHGGMIYGINARPRPARKRDFDRTCQLLAALGADMVRADFTWASIEPQKDQYHWKPWDQIVTRLDKLHIGLSPMLAYTTQWASSRGDKPWLIYRSSAPTSDRFFADFARSVAQRYPSIDHYEIWNEPDIGFWIDSAKQYVNLFNAAYTAIKSVRPNAQILNGGFSETFRNPDKPAQIIQGIAGKLDIFAWHTHGPLRNERRAFAAYSKLAKRYGIAHLPVWINEAGFSTPARNGEYKQVGYLIRKIAWAQQQGVKAFFWYSLRDRHDTKNAVEYNYGSTTFDFQPKPALAAYRNLIRQLTGLLPAVQPTGLPIDITALHLANQHRQALVLWSTQIGDQVVALKTNATGSLVQIGPLGRRHPVPIIHGQVWITVSWMPTYLLCSDPAATFTASQTPLAVPATVYVTAKKNVRLPITLHNPTNLPITIALRLAPDNAWLVTPANLHANLQPGQTQHLAVVGRPRDQRPLRIDATLDRRVLSLSLPIQHVLQLRRLDPKNAQLDRLNHGWPRHPTVRLRWRSQVVDLFVAIPDKQLHWHGPSDLSANIYLAANDQDLLVLARVTDDKHHPAGGMKAPWKGDSMQLALTQADGSRLYEFSGVLAAGGQAKWICDQHPLGAAAHLAQWSTASLLQARRRGTTTTYLWRMPLKLVNLKPGGIGRIDLIINDNDGIGRKGWIGWTAGMGDGIAPQHYKTFRLPK